MAKRKSDGTFYAVKVLQKKSILKNKEVTELRHRLRRRASESAPEKKLSSHVWLPKMVLPPRSPQSWVQKWAQQGVQWVPRRLLLLKGGRPSTSPRGSLLSCGKYGAA